MYFEKLSGKNIFLSPIDINDAEKYTKWLNDIEVVKYLELITQIVNVEKERYLLEQLNKSATVFAIIHKESGKMIGNTGLHKVNHLHSKAEAGIFIGDKNFWNRGYGTEAMQLLLDYGFNILNLHNISLKVIDYNERAFKSYRKCGFKEVGCLRESYQIGGELYDMRIMDILSTEYDSAYVNDKIKKSDHEEKYGAKLEIVE